MKMIRPLSYTILFNLFLIAALFSLLEIVSFFLVSDPYVVDGYTKAYKKKYTGSYKYKLTTHWDETKKSSFSQTITKKKDLYRVEDIWESVSFDKNYTIIKKNLNSIAKNFTQKEDMLIYRVRYTTDKYGRRTIPYRPQTHKIKSHFSFFGCSFIFGEGLEDNQTLPYFFQTMNPGYAVYNLSRPAGSVADAITTIQMTDLWSSIEPTNGVVLFAFSLPMHIPRFLGTLLNVGTWNENGVVIEASKKTNRYEYSGTFINRYPAWTSFSKIASKSSFLRLIKFDWPQVDENVLDKYARAINDFRDYYRDKYKKNNNLIVYIMPLQNDSWRIIPFLEKYKIPYLDYSTFPIQNYAQSDLRIPYDHHPTEEYNKIMATQITKDLLIKENQLFLKNLFLSP
jgi:hypothetical protein